MCIGTEFTNLCKCGCTEVEHDEPSIQETMLAEVMLAESCGFSAPVRGKCRGKRLSYGGLSACDPAFKPEWVECDCLKYEPIFKPMCTGFGGGTEDDFLGKKF